MKKILVVDDDDGILDAIHLMLEVAGYDVITSSDAEYIKHINSHEKPDLILLDVLLSGQDGRNICKKLKKNSETQNIPIIMISAHPIKTIKEEAQADDFLPKPFDMTDLLDRVEKFVK